MSFALNIAGDVLGTKHNIQVVFDGPPPLHLIREAAEALFTTLLRSAVIIRTSDASNGSAKDKGYSKGASTSPHPSPEVTRALQEQSSLPCLFFLTDIIACYDDRLQEWQRVLSGAQLYSGQQLYCFQPPQPAMPVPQLGSGSLLLVLDRDVPQHLPSPRYRVRWGGANVPLYQQTPVGEEDEEDYYTMPSPLPPPVSNHRQQQQQQQPQRKPERSPQESPAPAQPPAPQMRARRGTLSQANGLSEKLNGAFAVMDTEGKGYLVLRDLFHFSEAFEDFSPRPRAVSSSGSDGGRDRSTGGGRARSQSLLGVPCTARDHLRHFFDVDLEDIVREADLDRDGRISHAEWTRYALEHPQVIEVFFQFYKAFREQHQEGRLAGSAAAAAAAAASSRVGEGMPTLQSALRGAVGAQHRNCEACKGK